MGGGKRKAKKKAAYAQRPASDRLPRYSRQAAAGQSVNNLRPLWTFEDVDRNDLGEFGWSSSHLASCTDLPATMADLGRLTWGELRAQQTGGKNRHRKHHEQDVESLSDEAKRRLVACQLDDRSDEMFRFRLSGATRLWGFVEGQVFHVVWLDPHHRVYPKDPN